MKKWLSGGIVALAAMVAVASPAYAAGPYDFATHDSGGWSHDGGVWTSSADAQTDGSFSLTASVDEPGVHVDEGATLADAGVEVGNSFTLAAGTYNVTVTFTNVTGAASGSGLGLANASPGIWADCQYCQFLTNGTGSGITLEYPPVDAPSSVTNATAWSSVTMTVSADDVVTLGGTFGATATAGVDNSLVHAHGGKATVMLTGTVASITVAPA